MVCNMDELQGHFGKWLSQTEKGRSLLYVNLKTKQQTKKPKLIDTEKILVVARGGDRGWEKWESSFAGLNKLNKKLKKKTHRVL